MSDRAVVPSESSAGGMPVNRISFLTNYWTVGWEPLLVHCHEDISTRQLIRWQPAFLRVSEKAGENMQDESHSLFGTHRLFESFRNLSGA